MAIKKKPQNKSEKKVVADKAPKKVSIDWSSKPAMVYIEFNGKTVNTHKSNAKILVDAGKAKLK